MKITCYKRTYYYLSDHNARHDVTYFATWRHFIGDWSFLVYNLQIYFVIWHHYIKKRTSWSHNPTRRQSISATTYSFLSSMKHCKSLLIKSFIRYIAGQECSIKNLLRSSITFISALEHFECLQEEAAVAAIHFVGYFWNM